jgi:hypothetical protein
VKRSDAALVRRRFTLPTPSITVEGMPGKTLEALAQFAARAATIRGIDFLIWVMRFPSLGKYFCRLDNFFCNLDNFFTNLQKKLSKLQN